MEFLKLYLREILSAHREKKGKRYEKYQKIIKNARKCPKRPGRKKRKISPQPPIYAATTAGAVAAATAPPDEATAPPGEAPACNRPVRSRTGRAEPPGSVRRAIFF